MTKADKNYAEIVKKLSSDPNLRIGHEYSNGELTEEYYKLWFEKLEYPPTMYPIINAKLANMENPTEDLIYKNTQIDGFIDIRNF
jgi:hypothetical protein